MGDLVKLSRPVIAIALLNALASLIGASSLHAESGDLDRWVPSLTLQSGLNSQMAEGHLATGDVLGPQYEPVPPPQPSLQPITQGSPATTRDRMMTPYAAIGLELMAPSWLDVPSRPRPFVHAEVAITFGPTYVLPNIGNYEDELRLPTSFPGFNVTPTEETILGQGARNEALVLPLQVTAGAGIAFTKSLGDRTLRIKTSVEYLREEVEFTGRVSRAVRLTQSLAGLQNFRHILLQAQQVYVYHGIGPGLEVELDTGRAGPFVLSLFAAAKGYAFIDNQKQVLVASNEFDEVAEFTFLKNKWAFGGALGMRFRWVPEKK